VCLDTCLFRHNVFFKPVSVWWAPPLARQLLGCCCELQWLVCTVCDSRQAGLRVHCCLLLLLWLLLLLQVMPEAKH
jgi:hypothetical protein